ncbi:phage major capsid protein [Phyllobacterium meliloti]|uniref:phage major capsid protein n=1 Tax=Phyllobacterium meliloti TaxID=555317 RepID=UPI001D14E617|nr:phage major capsid protein [Phyllobacterium sp. T1293]UGX87114.1 phage major capsid protein [Phyllobacterium sp. T1293]
MSTITELREKQATIVAEARAALADIKSDTPEARVAELEGQHDKAMAEYDRIEARIAREEKLAEREAELNAADERRPLGENRAVKPGGEKEKEDRHADAFRSYLRNGLDGMDIEERKALRELRAQAAGTDTAGGYTVPQGFSNELVVSLKAWGPMLDPGVVRQVVTATGNQIDWPTLNDTANKGYRLSENTAATNEGDLVFGNKNLDAYKYASGPILVSSELIQDSAFDVEQLVRDAMAERIGRKVNEDLTIGDGTGDPNGIVTASVKGADAAVSAINFDNLIDLVHSIDPAYRKDPSVKFMFSDGTLKALRKIKDLEGNYIWQPADARTAQPSSILSYGYEINQDMATAGVSTKSVLFGAFNRYIVRRVREIAIRRLVERYAEFDQVGFIGFARFDGELMDTAAVKHLLHAAS